MEPLEIPAETGQLRSFVSTGMHDEGDPQVSALQASVAEVANIAVRPVNLDRKGMTR
jgi:hypothetical protein